uniref:Uncharacterized protein n=1 Tax=Syphacia muris TaxID=451379 RepID=A0A0N5ACM9_9BILA
MSSNRSSSSPRNVQYLELQLESLDDNESQVNAHNRNEQRLSQRPDVQVWRVEIAPE